ncbi:MAG: hypothetical protein JXB10_19465 [Pirellulales bacterium]|nr:hypothetical protein [Pirellulales bacterium]
MSAELTQTVPGWERVRSALEEIRACHAETEDYLQSVTAEFDQWGETLAHRQRLLQHEAARQQENQASVLHAYEERFSAWQKAVDRQLADLQNNHATAEEQSTRLSGVKDELTAWQKEIQQQRGEFQKHQATLETQIARLGDAAAAVTAGQEELETHHREWARQCEALTALPNALAATQQAAPQLDPTFEELQQRYAELQQERTLLESELENVRGRAAELTESLGEQKRAVVERQSHWDEELNHMRLLLENIARSQAEAERQSAQHWAAAAAQTPAADPVLGSVLAQFELIEKDCARRREGAAMDKQDRRKPGIY